MVQPLSKIPAQDVDLKQIQVPVSEAIFEKKRFAKPP